MKTAYMNFRSLITLASGASFYLACFLLALLITAGLPASPAFAMAQETPVVVRVSPAAVQVVAGQVVEVSVEVAEARDLYGADVLLSFDPAVVEVVDADPSLADIQVAQGAFFDPGFTLRNIADNTAGSVQFALTQLNPSLPKSGNGTLVVIKLRGRESGRSTQLTIDRAEVAQRNGNKLAVTAVPGQVQVVATATPGPTATSFPTQAAGTPLATSTPMPAAAVTDTPVPPAGQATPTSTANTTAAASPTPPPTAAPTNTRPASEAETQAGQTPASEATPTLIAQQPVATPTEAAISAQLTEAPTTETLAAADQTGATASAPATPTPAAVAAAIPENEGAAAQPIEDVQAPAQNADGFDPGLLWVAGGLLMVAAGAVLVVLLLRRKPA